MIPLDSYCTGQARFVYNKDKEIGKDVDIVDVHVIGIAGNGLVVRGRYDGYIVQATVRVEFFYYWFWRNNKDKVIHIPEPIKSNAQWTEWKVINGN